jgi:hypothetical protein
MPITLVQEVYKTSAMIYERIVIIVQIAGLRLMIWTKMNMMMVFMGCTAGG